MGIKQQVTVREYFAEMKRMQNINPSRDRLDYAKAYIRNRLNINATGVPLVSYIQAESVKRGIAAAYVIAEYALKELNARIEEDIIEYAAEYGLATLGGLKEDALEAKNQEKITKEKGWCALPARTSLEELEDVTELEIVLSHERPPFVKVEFNPFAIGRKSEDSPFKSDEESLHDRIASEMYNLQIPFAMNKQPKDYDSMTEEEWQKEKEDNLAALVTGKMSNYSKSGSYFKDTNKEQMERTNKALSLQYEDFPDFVYYPT